MKRIYILLTAIVVVILGIIVLKSSSMTSVLLWNISDKGARLLPLVLVSALLDSVHPCSFSILLLTIAFLFGMEMTRKRILQIGGVYVAGIFTAYFLIGLGILRVLHIFNTPHFMGRIGATLLIIFGIINIVNYFFPRFPIKLKLPAGLYSTMGGLMERTSVVAAFGLGLLVGICQFPCMGGPYLMVIGLLRDQVTYISGVLHLLTYNLILIIPLVAVLLVAADRSVLDKIQEWKIRNVNQVKLWAGLIMILLGAFIFFI